MLINYMILGESFHFPQPSFLLKETYLYHEAFIRTPLNTIGKYKEQKSNIANTHQT